MFKIKKEHHKLERLNIVPIMDAVFIFIFFLLFSAQFVKIFEIETEAPIVSEVPSDVKLDDEPLNLIVKLYDAKYELYIGIDKKLHKTFYLDNKNFEKILKEELLALRTSYPKDDQVIITPLPNISYDKIIKAIDLLQTIPKDEVVKILKDAKEVELKKIFTQIVLEAVDEV